MEINHNSLKRQQKILKPNLDFKNTNGLNSGTKKLEIIRVAQENQHMLKRINERGSYYNTSKWEKDYERAQYYKRNHCIYPSIDFYKTQRNYNLTQENKPHKTNYSSGKKYRTFADFDAHDFEGVKNIQSEQRKKALEEKRRKELEEERKKPKKLYETQTQIGDLGNCDVEFYVLTQNFNIKIQSKDYPQKAFECVFNSRESIENIQKYYQKYDEIINDLNYDSDENMLKFNNEDKPGLECVNKYFLFFLEYC